MLKCSFSLLPHILQKTDKLILHIVFSQEFLGSPSQSPVRRISLTTLAWTSRNQASAQHKCKDEKDSVSSLRIKNLSLHLEGQHQQLVNKKSFSPFNLIIVSLFEWNQCSFIDYNGMERKKPNGCKDEDSVAACNKITLLLCLA